jgi:hypothetical protein
MNTPTSFDDRGAAAQRQALHAPFRLIYWPALIFVISSGDHSANWSFCEWFNSEAAEL